MPITIEKGCGNIIIETEGQVLCTMWQDPRDCSEAVDGFPEMCSYSQVCRGSKISYTSRNANLVTYLCAKEALKLDVLAISLFVTPTYLIEMC